MRKLFFSALVALTPLCAYAQTNTQIIASGAIKDAGSVISVGTVSITGVDVNGQPVPFADGDGNAHGTSAFACKIVSGGITGAVQSDGTVSGTCQVPNSLTVPGGIYYTVQVCDTSTGTRISGKCFTYSAVPGISGAQWDLGMFSPNPVVTTMRAARSAVVPPHCDFAGFINNTTNHNFYGCDADGTYHVLGTTGAQGQQGLPGPTPALQIGNVQTLSPGSQATVAIRGSQAQPIVDFGIPRGADGTGGSSSIPIPVLADSANGNSYAVTTVAGRMHLAVTTVSGVSSVTLPGGGTLTVTNGRLHISQ